MPAIPSTGQSSMDSILMLAGVMLFSLVVGVAFLFAGTSINESAGTQTAIESIKQTILGFGGNTSLEPATGAANCDAACIKTITDYFDKPVDDPEIQKILTASIPAKGTCSNTVLGDISGDGVVHAIDVQLVVNAMLEVGDTSNPCLDINDDGFIDAIDVQLVVNAVLGIMTCSDGTNEGECSHSNTSMVCQNGELEFACESCGCDNLFSCQSNGICAKNELSKPSYNCTVCNGFCYTNDSKTKPYCSNEGKYYEWNILSGSTLWGKACTTDDSCLDSSGFFKCIDGKCLLDRTMPSVNYPVKIEFAYPRFVDKDSSFIFSVKIKNVKNQGIKAKIFDVLFSYLADEGNPNFEQTITFDESKQISSQSEETFEITIPTVEKETFTGNISFQLSIDDSPYSIGFDNISNGLIIVNDCLPEEHASCGDLTYCKYSAVCIDDKIYPISPQGACKSNSDCAAKSVCLNYSCEYPSALSSGLNLDKTNNVGLLGVFIYDDDIKYNEIKSAKLNELKQLAESSTSWFNSERIYWNAQNNFNVQYEVVQKDCRLKRGDYLNILESCTANQINGCEKKIISACGAIGSYDIIAKHEFWQDGFYDQEISNEQNRIGYPGAVGLNLDDVVLFGYEDSQGGITNSVLIHEILHSFGEQDLYLSNYKYMSFYQERNCNLFRARWDNFDIDPHLCNFEAKMIGWVR